MFYWGSVVIAMFIVLIFLIIVYIVVVILSDQIVPADRVFFGGPILTMDSFQPQIEALAYRDGLIAAVGSKSHINRFIGDNTIVTDLQGKTLMPGFIDAGSLFPYNGYIVNEAVNVSQPPFGDVTSVDEIISLLEEAAPDVELGGWLVAYGYDPNYLPEGETLNRTLLDGVREDIAIWVLGRTADFGVANSLALERSGVTDDPISPSPVGGVVVRNEDGEATGLLLQTAAFAVSQLVPFPPIFDDIVAAGSASAVYAANGVTTANNGIGDPLTIQFINSAVASDIVKIRVIIYPSIDTTNLILSGVYTPELINNRIKIGATKFILDGSIQSYTAFLREPYETNPPFNDTGDYRGFLGMDRKMFRSLFYQYHGEGLQLAINGTGDATIELILNTLEEAQILNPREDARHVIIHSEMLSEEQIERMAKLPITSAFVMPYLYYWGDFYVSRYLGDERAQAIDQASTSLSNNILATMNTDAPVTPINILKMIEIAVNRQTITGQVLGLNQAITVQQALEMTTINVAKQNFVEKEIGSFAVNKYADMIILSDNPLTHDPTTIGDIQVVETIVNGETVHLKN